MPPARSKKDWFPVAALALAVLLLLVLVDAAAFRTTPAGPPRSIIVRIRPGTTLSRVSKMLQEQGVVSSARKFYWLARLSGQGSHLQAGEYDLSPSFTPSRVLEMLARGRVRLSQVTIPEGYTMRQVAAALEGAGLGSAERFLAACSDKALITDLGVEGQNLEGYLYPDTYNIAFYMTEAAIARKMVRRFLSVWRRYAEEARQKGATMRQVVTLASIIERETAQADERPLVSAVFHNRLKRGMRLQSDPTVIYGLAGLFNGNLTRRHLLTPTAYNTYCIKGLPPGPIASPGEASLRAALRPAACAYLYFVSRNDGSHAFSATLAEHRRAVAQYQRQGQGSGGVGISPCPTTLARDGAAAEAVANSH